MSSKKPESALVHYEDIHRIFTGKEQSFAFIGSGLSMENSCSWEKARKNFKELLTSEGIREKDIEKEFEFKRNIFMKNEFIKKCIEYDDSKIPNAYRKLVMLPFSFFLTTNFDNNIENAYREIHHENIKVILPSRLDEAFWCLSKKKPFVLKIHGSVDECYDILVFTKMRYDDIMSDVKFQKLREFIKIAFSSYSSIFLGYGRRDPHIQYHLKKTTREYEDHPQRILFDVSEKKNSASDDGFTIIPIRKERIPSLLSQEIFLYYRENSNLCFSNFFDYYVKLKDKAVIPSHVIMWSVYFHIACFDVNFMELSEFINILDQKGISRVDDDESSELLILLLKGVCKKKNGKTNEAQEYFDKILRLSKNDSISKIIRCLCVRYAAIFYHRTLKNMKKANSLYHICRQFISSEGLFSVEKCDLEKWYAVYLCDTGEFDAGIRLLKDTADKSGKNGYTKTFAWCNYAIAECYILNYKKNIAVKYNDDIGEYLNKALYSFQKISLYEGIALTYLQKSILYGLHTNYKRIPRELEYAESHAKLIGYKSIQMKCRKEREKYMKSKCKT